MKKAAVPSVSKKTSKRVSKKPAVSAVQKETMEKPIKKAATPASSTNISSSAARKRAMKKPNSANKFLVDEKANSDINKPALEQPKKAVSAQKSNGETNNPASDEIIGDEGSDADADNGPLSSFLSAQVAIVTGQVVLSLPTATVCPN